MKRKIISLILASVMTLTLAGCSGNGEVSSGGNDTLVIGTSDFNGIFSPFFYNTAYDAQAFETVFTSVSQTNENNELIDNGGSVTGEEVKSEDGSVQTKYTIKLKDNMKFQDGKPVTIDDLIFTYYVYADPTYDGMSTFATAIDIVGLKEYYYDDANYSTKVAQIGEEAKAKAATEEGFLEYLIKSNCADWYAGDPNGDIGDGRTFIQYLKDEGYDADSVASDKDAFLQLLAKCEYEKYADGYDPTGWWTTELSKDYINAGLADGIDVETIEGIEKVDDLTCTVLVNGINITADRQLGLTPITPKHYYGENFKKGDLSGVKDKTDSPMGSGPYEWVGYENNVVTVKKFDDYFLGTPKIENIKYQVIDDEQKVNAVISGDIDITDPSASLEIMKELEANSIEYSLVGNPGYGYIAISAKRVPDKNVREGLMHLMTRDQAIKTYYGELAQVIQRPMTPTLAEYPIDAKEYWGYDKAKALECFKAAGYEQVDGKLVKDGKQLSIEVGIGQAASHPSTPILTQMKSDMEELGAELVVSDLDFSILSNRQQNDDIDMWVMAWGNATDCDLTQMFGSEYTKTGGSNRTWVQDPEIDALLKQVTQTLDFEERKQLVAEELDKIMSWATYMPVYQRKNLYIYNTNTINMDTIPENTSTYYNYVNEIHLLELK
ncbi:ABC transporter substrate-binding protein [Clostridium sp. Sa3CUN1]|uniref:ABC transporter substrate-binding protein n=1 Tax=Clostridium gallinarum TaxID=2762246 RepID=A0ABR8Q641_9CLOT|nr:ABC transporter substrate-binding protein [Clostridium gallinarum]MBD7915883.1 ABC transporter substrate-binding protein [Clostridium gallinarum]